MTAARSGDAAAYARLLRERPEWFRDPADAAIRLQTRGGAVAYADAYLTVLTDEVLFPGDRPGRYVRVMPAAGRPNGVVVLPLVGDRVVLVRQFRHAVRDWRLELPRGFGEPGLDGEANARRELLEETGYVARSVRALGAVEPDTGLMGTRADLFLADIDPEGRALAVAERGATLIEITVRDFARMVAEGTITDAFSLAAWARAGLA